MMKLTEHILLYNAIKLAFRRGVYRSRTHFYGHLSSQLHANYIESRIATPVTHERASFQSITLQKRGITLQVESSLVLTRV